MDKGSWHCTEGSDQDHPREKEMQKKANCLSEEALQVAVTRREAKGKGEKEKHTHLNAEFQIAGSDKKPSSVISEKK